MPAERKPGLDNPYFDWSPIATRPKLTWPGNARLALFLVLSVEHWQWKLPPNAHKSPDLPGGVSGAGRPFPDVITYSMREYGHRVGIFRLMKLLDKYGFKATVAIDSSIAGNYPYLINECKKRGYEFIAHGVAVNQMISAKMSESEEREHLKTSIDTVAKATGSKPLGWMGAEYGESERTNAILAEMGIKYNLDWPNDDQPYAMKVPTGEMYSLPLSMDLDDTFNHWYKRVHYDIYTQMIKDSFDVLYKEGEKSGRVMGINLHPWLSGQPFRYKMLDEALRYIAGREGVWSATGSEIMEWHKKQTKR
jgi:peptidoglycan/xylan/chitin deacetylase (PgdA/CDA1 family)